MKNRYFKSTKTIILAVFFVGIVNLIHANGIVNNANICIECFEVEQSEELKAENSQLESWMLDESFWKLETKDYTNFLNEIQDFPVKNYTEIEDWMLDNDFWKSDETEEQNLVIEPWMVDSDFWRI